MATTKEKGRDSGKSATPTTSANDTALVLCLVKGEPRIDSRLLAQHMANPHPHVRMLHSATSTRARGYAHAKHALARFGTALLGGGHAR